MSCLLAAADAWRFNDDAGGVHGASPSITDEKDAQPLDLDSSRAGVQAEEELHDIEKEMSVAWVEPLGKWVMLYGGGLTRLPTPVLKQCGVFVLFVGAAGMAMNMANGAVRNGTADDPWGPWMLPQDVIAGGVPAD